MKVTLCTSFGLFALLAISLVFACHELVNCSFTDEKSGSSDVPVPEVNVLPPSLPSLSSEAASCIAEPPMVQAPFAEMLPCELWPEIFSSCAVGTLCPCLQVCSLWKNIITSNYMITKLCMLGVEDEANFARLLLLLKQRSREELKVLLQRFYDEKLVRPKVLMDLIVRLFMMADVLPIVLELLRDLSIPMSKLFKENCRPRSADDILKDSQKAKCELRLAPELVKAVFKDLTPENWHHWLSLPSILRQLMEKAIEENTAALALPMYRQLEGTVRLSAEDFPTLSCIEPLLPVIFPVPSMHYENGYLFPLPCLYLQLEKMWSSEEIMSKEMADKMLDTLSLVEINEQSLKLLVPHLCPSFLKDWKERETEVGKRIIDQFLEISLEFKKLNGGIDYSKALMSTDFSVIQGAINSLAKIDSVPFFLYRPMIVRFIYWMELSVSHDASKAPFSGVEYPQFFMEDLCIVALRWSAQVHAFLKFLDHKQRSSLASYNTVLTSSLFSRFKENWLDCEVLSAVPSSP